MCLTMNFCMVLSFIKVLLDGLGSALAGCFGLLILGELKSELEALLTGLVGLLTLGVVPRPTGS